MSTTVKKRILIAVIFAVFGALILNMCAFRDSVGPFEETEVQSAPTEQVVLASYVDSSNSERLYAAVDCQRPPSQCRVLNKSKNMANAGRAQRALPIEEFDGADDTVIRAQKFKLFDSNTYKSPGAEEHWSTTTVRGAAATASTCKILTGYIRRGSYIFNTTLIHLSFSYTWCYNGTDVTSVSNDMDIVNLDDSTISYGGVLENDTSYSSTRSSWSQKKTWTFKHCVFNYGCWTSSYPNVTIQLRADGSYGGFIRWV